MAREATRMPQRKSSKNPKHPWGDYSESLVKVARKILLKATYLAKKSFLQKPKNQLTKLGISLHWTWDLRKQKNITLVLYQCLDSTISAQFEDGQHGQCKKPIVAGVLWFWHNPCHLRSIWCKNMWCFFGGHHQWCGRWNCGAQVAKVTVERQPKSLWDFECSFEDLRGQQHALLVLHKVSWLKMGCV